MTEKTPMIHQCCGREVCDGKDCKNNGPLYKIPKWRMDAYYYGFEPTGVAAIDKILSAVACAGKCFHHTEDWMENVEGSYPYHTGVSPSEWIQNAANQAAAVLSENIALQAKLDEANLLALSLQGQIVTMMAQPTEAWKLTYTHPVAKSQVVRVLSFDPMDSYSDFAPDYKVTELIPRVSPL